MTKASLGRGKTGSDPVDHGKLGLKRSVLCEGKGLIGLEVDGTNQHDM